MAKMIFLVLTLVCYFTPFASAQEAYPTKPIEILIGVPPGSWSDTSTRMLNPFVEKQLGTKLIVVNKPGASGSLAAKQVVHSNPDGYTLFCVNHQFIIFGAISENAPYSVQDFEPIGKMATSEGVIFVKPDSPWKTFDEVIEYARKDPRKLRVAIEKVKHYIAHANQA
jgi:tripartite-type tricarboxylate transporter receptor subunit TctC